MTTITKTHSRYLLPLAGIIYLLCQIGIIYLYLNVPTDLAQFKYWAPRDQHSAEVATIYREALGVTYHPVKETTFRIGNLVLIVSIFICYSLAVVAAKKSRLGRFTFVVSALMGLAALFIPPFYATDIFYYSITGQITGLYQQNPYLQVPGAFPDSVFFPYNFWVDITSPYGPLWTAFSGLVVRLSQAHLFWTPFAFKIVNLFALWGCTILIYHLWRNVYPSRSPWGSILFLWNPLVLFESVSNGHNDILMALFIMLGAFFLLTQRPLTGFLAVLLAVWIKYLPAPLAIWLFLVRLRNDSTSRLRTVISYGVVFVGVLLLVWFPYWEGFDTVASLFAESARGLSGPIAFVINILSDIFIFEPIMVITTLFITLFVSMLAWGGWRLYTLFRKQSTYTPQDEAIDWATIFTWIVVVLPGAHPWYTIPILALLAGFYIHAPRRAAWLYVFFSFWFFYRAVAWI